MNDQNFYWYFSGALGSKFCDDVIKYALQKEEVKAITGEFGRKRNVVKEPLNEEEVNRLNKKRNSDVVWLDERWIYREIQPYINEANRLANWNFDWDCDSFNKPYENIEDQASFGKIRKLSVTCQLTDGSEYQGGELEFQPRNGDDPNPTVQCKEILPKGSIVVFPSYVWHRVKPVTKGTRYSLVLWNLGYPFR